MSFFAEGLVTGPDIWESLPMGGRQESATPPDGAHYREMAHGLRALARQCRFPGAKGAPAARGQLRPQSRSFRVSSALGAFAPRVARARNLSAG